MTEPANTIASTTLFGIAALSVFFPNANESLMLAAFCGSVMFVLSKSDLKNAHKLVYMLLSFFLGILGAADAAAIMSGLLNMLPFKQDIVVSHTIGALFCSVIIVHILNIIPKIDLARWMKLPQKDEK